MALVSLGLGLTASQCDSYSPPGRRRPADGFPTEIDGGSVPPPNDANSSPDIVDAGNVSHPTWPSSSDNPSGKPVPAISGGTLLITHDGHTAVASDPEHDGIVVADLIDARVLAHIALDEGDEPGRLVEDAAGHVHVVLRSSGAIASIDPATGALLARQAVCASPRGIAYEPARDSLHVACASGELLTLPAAGGAATRRLTLPRDLRDVVVRGDHLLVTRFRSAEIFAVAADGTVSAPHTLPRTPDRGRRASRLMSSGALSEFVPEVAWHAVAVGDTQMAIVHQRASNGEVVVLAGGYSGNGFDPCSSSIVQTAVSFTAADGTTVNRTPTIPGAVLPVDVAFSARSNRVALVAAGSHAQLQSRQNATQLHLYDKSMLDQDAVGGCMLTLADAPQPTGQAVAVAFDGSDRVIVQTRNPSAIHIVGGASVALPGLARQELGHTIFHANAGGGLACASCHPEGDDDGRVWSFAGVGPRRTQNLRGKVSETAPFHWNGEMTSFDQLMNDVFSQRMNGGTLTADQQRAVAGWVDTLPALPVVRTGASAAEAAAIARGRALFTDPASNCAGCHAGAHFTSPNNWLVGTQFLSPGVLEPSPMGLVGFQAPSLRGVAYRPPYMHTGCAATLRERFTNPACGGGDAHGNTSRLSSAQLDDLLAYLESL